jgi:hypothetical protein
MAKSAEARESLLSFFHATHGPIIAIISTSFARFFLPEPVRIAPSRHEVKVEVFTRFRHQGASVSSAFPLSPSTRSCGPWSTRPRRPSCHFRLHALQVLSENGRDLCKAMAPDTQVSIGCLPAVTFVPARIVPRRSGGKK